MTDLRGLGAGVAIVVATCIWFAFKFIEKLTLPREFQHLPNPPQSSWLFGNMLETRGCYAKWKKEGNFPEPYSSWRKKYGSVVYIREVSNHGLIVMDPKAIQHVLVSNASNYPRHAYPSEYFKEILFGVGLLSSHGPQHDKFRKILNPLFTAQSVKSFIPLFEAHALRCCDEVLSKANQDKTPLNMLTVFQQLTLEIIGLAVFGCNLVDNQESNKAYNEFQLELNPILFLALFISPKLTSRLPLPSLKKRRNAHRQLKQIMMDAINQKLENSESSDKPRDLLDLMLPYSTDQEALVHTMTLMTGGHETTSATLAWVFLTLSSKPEVVARIREEYASAVAKHGSLSTWEAVGELQFTLAVIHETLRLNSVGFILIRVADEADTLPLMDGSTVSVPKGTALTLYSAAVHRSPEFWHAPESFEPERFIEGTPAWSRDNKLRQHVNQKIYFFGFSNGSKGCIGQRFALAELQVLVSTLLSRFDFEATSDSDSRHKFNGIVVHPVKLNMHVSRVAQAA